MDRLFPDGITILLWNENFPSMELFENKTETLKYQRTVFKFNKNWLRTEVVTIHSMKTPHVHRISTGVL